MKDFDRLETCRLILRNAGVEDYWLARGGELVLPADGGLSLWQRLAVRAAQLVLAGAIDPEVAVWLGLT